MEFNLGNQIKVLKRMLTEEACEINLRKIDFFPLDFNGVRLESQVGFRANHYGWFFL